MKIEKYKKPGRRISIIVGCALAAMTLPLLLAMLVTATTFMYINAQNRQTLADTTRIASIWLADALTRADTEDYSQLMRRLEIEMGTLVGLFDRSGFAVAPTQLNHLSDAEIRRLINAPVTETTVKEHYYITASAPVYTPDGRLTVIVASTNHNRGHRWTILSKIGLYSGFFILICGVLGLLHGEQWAQILTGAQRRLAARMTQNSSPSPSPSFLDTPRETQALHRSIDLLEKRFLGELAIYKDALDEVEMVDQQRTKFLTAVAKELRAPLESIDAQASGLLCGEFGKLNDQQREDLAIVDRASRRLLGLVDEVLDFSSLIQTEIQFDPEPVDLTEVVKEVVETGRGQILPKPIELKYHAPQLTITVEGNRRRLWQLLTNLVSNAIKFTERGEVTVTLKQTEESQIVITVTDTGIGIPPSEHESIFDPFSQHGALSKRRQGAGLGLAITQKLVQRHGGSIELSSEVGHGSTFAVVLPSSR